MRNQILDILIVIPAYNEEKTIGKVINQVKQTPYNFVVVNDGSTDRTSDVLFFYTKSHQRINYPDNRGKGFAIHTGANWAKLHKYRYILVIDADGQHALSDIELFDYALQKHPEAQIIIGNRLCNPKNMPFIRLITNKVMSWLISKLAKCKIIDSQCGMRLISVDVFNTKLKSHRFEMESEMLIIEGNKGKKIINVPIRCIYNKNRISKINPLSDTIRFIKLLWRYYG